MALVRYSTRFDSRELVQRGRDTPLACRVYRSGALVTPTQAGSTFSLISPAGEAVVDAQAVTVSGSVATYTVLGTVTDDQDLGEGWLARWVLVLPDGTHTFEAQVAVCRCVPACPVTERALYARAPGLDPDRPGALSTRRDWAVVIDDCWSQLRELLLDRGNRPELVVTSADLREPLVLLCLAQIFEGLAPQTRDTTYADEGARYRARFGSLWGQTQFRYDADDDGLIGEDETKRPARGPTFYM